jgi:hypothetical protein
MLHTTRPSTPLSQWCHVGQLDGGRIYGGVVYIAKFILLDLF